MSFIKNITAALLFAFLGYIALWYFEKVEGNFSFFLFLATVITGVYWIAEKVYFFPARKKVALILKTTDQERREKLMAQGIDQGATDIDNRVQQALAQPWWLDWTAGFFPVIIVVFLLRSFAFEPFKIPSGSMMPTLLVGDLILVNKFVYGLRLPVLHTKVTEGSKPARGDVMVFRYPPQPNLDYIKRVIGVPGDEVSYLDKKLKINGVDIDVGKLDDYLDRDSSSYLHHFSENLKPVAHEILTDDRRPPFVQGVLDFKYKENCQYFSNGVSCKVPDGHYFMMGDNRDNSMDSRYWGFVPEENIVGKAFFIWMNFFEVKRIGRFD